MEQPIERKRTTAAKMVAKTYFCHNANYRDGDHTSQHDRRGNISWQYTFEC